MPHQIRPRVLAQLCCVALLGLSGCVATPPSQESTFTPPVYPSPPDEPRFIFEQTLRYNSNVQAESDLSALRRFATGEKAIVKGLVKPFDVAATQGRVYVTDTVQRALIMFDIEGQRYAEFGHEAPGELFKPIGLDISIDNEIYVADVSAQRISVFDLEGQFLRYIGDRSLLTKPSDIAISKDGRTAFVIDTGGVDNKNHQLHIFDAKTGEHRKTIGQRGKEEGEFNLPLQLASAENNLVYIVDKGNFRVQSFTADGNFEQSFGSIGRMPGQFFSPKGIATDADNNLYVVDTAFGNVQIFNEQGQLLMVIGQRGQSSLPGNYMLPAGIDVDEQGRIYIVDQFFRKVDIYRPISIPARAPINAKD